MAKYLNRKVTEDGLTFDSRTEHKRYLDLRNLVRAGEIEALEIHPKYRIDWPGSGWLCSYTADFRYVDRRTGETIVEDVKSPRTQSNSTYRLKKKLLRFAFGVEITEIVG